MNLVEAPKVQPTILNLNGREIRLACIDEDCITNGCGKDELGEPATCWQLTSAAGRVEPQLVSSDSCGCSDPDTECACPGPDLILT